MYTKTIVTVALSLLTVAMATPHGSSYKPGGGNGGNPRPGNPRPGQGNNNGGNTGNSCSTGPVQCCNSVEHSQSPLVQLISGVLGAVVPVDANVGLSCSPIDVIGIGSNSCNAQTVCCENNKFNGLINLGCSPINIVL